MGSVKGQAWIESVHTRLAGPRVLSTSKRQIVFFIGRASRGG